MVTYNTIPKPNDLGSPFINSVSGYISSYPYIINLYLASIYGEVLKPQPITLWSPTYYPWLSTSYPWQVTNQIGYIAETKPITPTYISIPKPS